MAAGLLLAGCGSGAPEPSDSPTSTDPTRHSGDVRAWADETFGDFEEVSLSGSGDETVDIPAEVGEARMGVIELDYAGDPAESGGFLAALVDADGELTLAGPDATWMGNEGDDVVRGQVIWQPHQNRFVEAQVQAHGDWTLTFKPISTVEELPAEGVGSQVYLYDGDGGDVTMRHDESYITVLTEYGEEDRLRQIIELRGPEADGTISAGPSVVIVAARGEWELDLPS